MAGFIAAVRPTPREESDLDGGRFTGLAISANTYGWESPIDLAHPRPKAEIHAISKGSDETHSRPMSSLTRDAWHEQWDLPAASKVNSCGREQG